jgi:hypothetical protein
VYRRARRRGGRGDAVRLPLAHPALAGLLALTDSRGDAP